MKPHPLTHPRTIGWFGTTAVAMGGINQSLFIMAALIVGQGAIPGQGSAAVDRAHLRQHRTFVP